MSRWLAFAGFVAGSLLIAGPAAAQQFRNCAEEGEYCRVPYPTTVHYGVAGRTTSRFVSDGGIPCSDRAFGDPAPRRRKFCNYEVRGERGGRYGRDRDRDLVQPPYPPPPRDGRRYRDRD
ncbi:MAG: hypothetical protein AB7O57_20395 [Hyphomicrobiaceae bacterium]